MRWSGCCVMDSSSPDLSRRQEGGVGTIVYTHPLGWCVRVATWTHRYNSLQCWTRELVFYRVGSRKAFLVREVTTAVKEERRDRLRLFGRMSGCGRRTGWRVGDQRLLVDQLGGWFKSRGAHTGVDWIFLMTFLHVEGEMT